jgi:hypothetical protein
MVATVSLFVSDPNYGNNDGGDPPPADPTRYRFNTDIHGLGQHDPYATPSEVTNPSFDSKITFTPELLTTWADLFEKAGNQLNLAGDHMTKIQVHPGYFQEANTIRDLVDTFNSTFVPNSRTLADSALYVARALRLVVKDFNDLENANLDKNTGLMDLISSLTKSESNLKPNMTIVPNTPTK